MGTGNIFVLGEISAREGESLQEEVIWGTVFCKSGMGSTALRRVGISGEKEFCVTLTQEEKYQ